MITSLRRVGLFTVVLSLAQSTSAQPAERLEEIDALRAEGRYEQAESALRTMIDQGEEGADVLWRLSWTLVDLGEQSHGERRNARYNEALPLARKATEQDTTSAMAWLVGSIAAGCMGLEAGTSDRVELSREVKEAADRAIELDSSLDGAYHVRARWNHEVASLGFLARTAVRLVYGGLPNASYEAAVEDFRHAIAIEDRVLHRMELGRTYQAMGETALAREQLQRALVMDDDDPKADFYRAQARDVLDRLR